MYYISPTLQSTDEGKVSVPEDVKDAVRTLLRWTGDDPEREGLVDTPARVARAWRDWCRGNLENPAVHLDRTFEDVGGYNEIIVLRDVPFHSHCEHHMAPIVGKASIAYLPKNRVVGISKRQLWRQCGCDGGEPWWLAKHTCRRGGLRCDRLDGRDAICCRDSAQ